MKKIIAGFVLAGFLSVTACDQDSEHELTAWRTECFESNAAWLVDAIFLDPEFQDIRETKAFSDFLDSLLAHTIHPESLKAKEKENLPPSLHKDHKEKMNDELLRIAQFLYSFHDEKFDVRKALATLFSAHATVVFQVRSGKAFVPITVQSRSHLTSPRTPQ